MLTIRLARTGKRNAAQFKIMLQERTVAPGGRHVEILGSYNPHSKETVLQADRIKYWIEKGAFVSDTMHNLLVKNGVISQKKRIVKLPKKAVPAEAEAPKEETPEEGEAVKNEEAVVEKKEPASNASHSDAGGDVPVEGKEVVAVEVAPVEKVEEAVVEKKKEVPKVE